MADDPTVRVPRQPLGRDDLIAAYYALARVNRRGVATVSLADRVAAAAKAGFVGLGTQPHDYERCIASGLTDGAIASILNDHEMVLAEFDGAPWWPREGEGSQAFDRAQQEALRVGATFGARHLIAPMPTIVDPPPMDQLKVQLAERLAALGDRAAPLGLLVGFEFLGWTPVADVRTALEIVRLADGANVGITLDFWHHSASGLSPEVLTEIPADRIIAVHLTDGTRNTSLDPLSESMTCRRHPGDGELPVEQLVRVLDQIGVSAPITVEAVSIAHRNLPAEELAKLLYTTTHVAITRARPA
jgi:sugar phosphate isomerase/epimerase